MRDTGMETHMTDAASERAPCQLTEDEARQIQIAMHAEDFRRVCQEKSQRPHEGSPQHADRDTPA